MKYDNLKDFVDLQQYPIDCPGTAKYSAMLENAQAMLAHDGCAVLPGFINAAGIRTLAAEAEQVSPCAYRSFNQTNVYFTCDDESLLPSHPLRRFYARTNAFVPADNFSEDSPLRGLYEHPVLMPFVQDVLGEKSFFRYADPLADVTVNVVDPSEAGEEGGFPWHFDTNSYTVTLALQNGESGGVFKYYPGLRDTDNENYEGVQQVLDGDENGVVNLNLQPGDLQIFRGRYSLHRVTPIEGNQPRYVAIFSFAAVPDMIALPERCKQLYGRVLPIHLEHERSRNDALRD